MKFIVAKDFWKFAMFILTLSDKDLPLFGRVARWSLLAGVVFVLFAFGFSLIK